MHLAVEHAHDLRHVPVPLDEAAHLAAELVARLLVELVVSLGGRCQERFDLALNVLAILAELQSGNGLSIVLVVHVVAVDLVQYLVDAVCVDGLR